MLSDVLQARIREYAPANAIEQENMLAELMQHYVLASLSRSGLFSTGMFHGGTCLRICHGMNRFSEDLDFLLKQAGSPEFAWEPHLRRTPSQQENMRSGRTADRDPGQEPGRVRRAQGVRQDGLHRQRTVDLPFERQLEEDRIRLRRQPAARDRLRPRTCRSRPRQSRRRHCHRGSEPKHALLCRYVKGRDW